MVGQVLTLLAKSKGMKVGAGAIGGSSLLALIFSLHTDLSTKIDEEKAERKEYIELVLKPLEAELRSLKGETTETKQMVRDIRNHLLQNRRGN